MTGVIGLLPSFALSVVLCTLWWWWVRWKGFEPICVLEDVALAIPHGELEGEGSVVALQHRRVVVQDCQLAAGVAQEGVGPARVVHVMHSGCNQGGHLIQLVKTALEWMASGRKGRDRVTPAFRSIVGSELLSFFVLICPLFFNEMLSHQTVLVRTSLLVKPVIQARS